MERENAFQSFKCALKDTLASLKCVICFGAKETREFPCSHKLCLNCLSNHEKENCLKFVCPACMSEVSRGKELSKDMLLNELCIFQTKLSEALTSHLKTNLDDILKEDGDLSEISVYNQSSCEVSNFSKLKKIKTEKAINPHLTTGKKVEILHWLNDESNQFDKITQTQNVVIEKSTPTDSYDMPSISQNVSTNKPKTRVNSLPNVKVKVEETIENELIDGEKGEDTKNKEVILVPSENITLTKASNSEKKTQSSWKRIRNLQKSIGTPLAKLKKLDISIQIHDKKLNRTTEEALKTLPEQMQTDQVIESIPSSSQVLEKTQTDNGLEIAEKLKNHVTSLEIIPDSLMSEVQEIFQEITRKRKDNLHCEDKAVQTDSLESDGKLKSPPNQYLQSEMINKFKNLISRDYFPDSIVTLFEIILGLISEKHGQKLLNFSDANTQTDFALQNFEIVSTQTLLTNTRKESLQNSQFDELILKNCEQLEALEKSNRSSNSGTQETKEIKKMDLRCVSQKKENQTSTDALKLNEILNGGSQNVEESGILFEDVLNQCNTEAYSYVQSNSDTKNNTQRNKISNDNVTNSQKSDDSQKSQIIYTAQSQKRNIHQKVLERNHLNFKRNQSKNLNPMNNDKMIYNTRRFVKDDISVIFDSESMEIEDTYENKDVCSQVVDKVPKNQTSSETLAEEIGLLTHCDELIEKAKQMSQVLSVNNKDSSQKQTSAKFNEKDEPNTFSSRKKENLTQHQQNTLDILKHCEDLIEKANAEMGISKNSENIVISSQKPTTSNYESKVNLIEDTEDCDEEKSQDLLDHYNNLIAVATKKLGKNGNLSKVENNIETQYDDDFFQKLEMLENANKENIGNNIEIVDLDKEKMLPCTPKRKHSGTDDEKQLKKVRATRKEENNGFSSSDDEFSSDADVIETTPQKSIVRENSLISKRSSSSFQTTAEILPPPVGFDDLAENRIKTVDKVCENLSPTKRSFTLGRKVSSSSSLNLQGAPIIPGIEPIIIDVCDEESLTQRNKPNSIMEIVQESRFSPLSIVPKPKSSQTSLISTPRQKSILNYITTNTKSSENNEESNCHTSQRKLFITYTRLPNTEISLISTLSSKQMASVEKKFTPDVTHLVVSVDKNNCVKEHTIKFVSAIAAGLWIVSPKWVRECLVQNKIVDEEPYEALDSSVIPSPRISRLTRLSNPLFKCYSFYVAGPFIHITLDEIKDVIKNLGGDVLQTMDEFRCKNENSICVILSDENSIPEDVEDWWDKYKVATLDVQWLILSICRYKILSFKTYVISPGDESVLETTYPPYLLEDVPDSLTQGYN